MPDMLENGDDDFKDEQEEVGEGNDLAMERVPTADGSASNAGAKPEAESDQSTGPTENADDMAMVPVDGEEGTEAQSSPKPPATVSNPHSVL